MKKILLVFLFVSLLLFSACSNKVNENDSFALEKETSSSSSEETSTAEEKVEEKNRDALATESVPFTKVLPETDSSRAMLDLDGVGLGYHDNEHYEYVDEAFAIGLLTEHWSSPEEINAENILGSIDYFNHPKFYGNHTLDYDNPSTLEYFIDEAEIEDYVLSKVDVHVSQLQDTSFYSEGRYNFKVMRDKGGMSTVSIGNSWESDGHIYVELIGLYDESKSVLKIDGEGKFVSYTEQE